MRRFLTLVALSAAVIVVLGWVGESLGDWAGSDPGRIKTVLIVETLVIVGLGVYVIRVVRRYRRTAQGE